MIVLLDALAASHVSHLGYDRETTPNIDRLASEGWTCRRAMSVAPYTVASIPSVLTGRLPDHHGVVHKNAHLADSEVTIAETLRTAGWRTLAAVGNMNGSALFGNDQGFDEFIEVFRAEDGRAADALLGEPGFHVARANEFPPIVARWLATSDARPPLMYLHILEPHEPYNPPSNFRAKWLRPAYDGPFVNGDSSILVPMRKGYQATDDTDRDAIRALYDGNLLWADSIVGEILERLRDAKLYDEALVIVTSDHGEAFWEHGEQGHNSTLYSEMVRVPLVVKFPRSWGRAPAVLERTVSPIDILPSLCDWLDLPVPPAKLDGVPLDSAAGPGIEDARRLVLRTNDDTSPDVGLCEGPWKTILYHEPHHGFLVEAFDLVRDPGELDPATLRRGERAHGHSVFLQAFRLKNGASARRDRDLSPSERAALEQLGYTE